MAILPVKEAPEECFFLSTQDGPRSRPCSTGVQKLWEKRPQVLQDEPRCLHTDWTTAGVLSVRLCAYGSVFVFKWQCGLLAPFSFLIGSTLHTLYEPTMLPETLFNSFRLK